SCSWHGASRPAVAYDALPEDERRLRFAELEQRARVLEEEVVRRRRLEVERAPVLEAERRAQAEIALLYRLTDAANRADTLDQVFAVALDGIAVALGVQRASILLLESDGAMRFKAWRGLSDAYRAAIEGHSPWPIDDPNPSPILIEDVRSDGRVFRLRPTLEREGIGALGYFPLRAGGRLIGKFTVCYPAPHVFEKDEQSLAMAIAHQIAFAVDRKLAAQERERVIGILGHDLRNPLTAVSVSAKMLLRRELPETITRPVRRIVTSAERMERLIAQLLTFTQARHGAGLTLNRRWTELAGVAELVADEIEAAHPAKRVRLAVTGDCRGDWDADRLAEVLSNLLGNAVQHGGDGPIDVRIRDEGPEVALEVHNDGPAIPPAVLPTLFDPFRRGTGRDEQRSNSVGLGLFISREIVRAHGGRIEARSTDADGTTFAVRLPRLAAR
ncbi:MAG TPA: GAF domain-containing sensor histidine kinase, partial [Anaeromyxobacteraceae bacterium]|nr:GAF domain-containing sensor histidine kinase [Anaeromyxobacteraceae bacterium]